MDAEVDRIAQILLRRLQLHTKRLLVGIAGIPASGKSTFARRLVNRINHQASQEEEIQKPPPPVAILVSLDGWHYTRAELAARFPDPKKKAATAAALDRRGSHWTFDSTSYVDFVRHLRATDDDDNNNDHTDMARTVISAPSFDHALKDPIPDAVRIRAHHRIVVIEGLYVFLSIEPWKKAGTMLDERCLIEVADPNEARERLVARHVLTGVSNDLDEANRRADENDVPNGRFLLANSLEPTQIIQNNDDPAFFAAQTCIDG